MTLPGFLQRLSKRRLLLLRRIMGDSMAPTLMPGRVVLGVWPRRIRVGDVVIVHHEGVDKVKRVKDLSDGKVYLVGDNPASSTDSRDFGWLDTAHVIAKVM